MYPILDNHDISWPPKYMKVFKRKLRLHINAIFTTMDNSSFL